MSQGRFQVDGRASYAKWTTKVGSVSHLALDEAVLAVMRKRRSARPAQAAVNSIATELGKASALFDEQGWLVSPAAYHRTPPPLTGADLAGPRTVSVPFRHEVLTFSSGFRPRDIEPGADRWVTTHRNDTVLVRLMRHRGNAPWVVCLHGFGMGTSRMDLATLWATHLHRKLGLNVAVPVLPLHGPRRTPDDDQMLSMDLTLTLHGISQAVWEVRRLVDWIRRTTGAPVGVYGLSLGGYLAALLAGIEPLDCVVAGVPFTDVPSLMTRHSPPPEYLEVLRAPSATDVYRVASPLAIPPLPGPDRLTILAASGDRFIPGEHPVALSEAWGSSSLRWADGGHVGFVGSRAAKRIVGERLQTGLGAPHRAG